MNVSDETDGQAMT